MGAAYLPSFRPMAAYADAFGQRRRCARAFLGAFCKSSGLNDLAIKDIRRNKCCQNCVLFLGFSGWVRWPRAAVRKSIKIRPLAGIWTIAAHKQVRKQAR